MIAPLEARWQRLRKRRAAAAGVRSEEYTLAEVYAQTGGKCHICKRPCGPRHGADWHVEHILPITKGGPDTLGNLAPAHPACNRAKGTRLTTLPEGPMRRALVTLAIAARLRNPAVGVAAVALAPLSVPHLTTYRLSLPPGKAHVTPSIIAEVRAALHLPTARVYAHGAELRIEVPRRMRQPVPLSAMPTSGLRIGVGVTSAGKAAVVDLGASPHVLVSGATGSGKSVMLRTLARGLASQGARLALVDSDADTWANFTTCAALEWAVAEDIDAAAATVAAVQAAMDARKVGADDAPLALLIDEVQMLDSATMAMVRDIAKRGRKRRVHLILATQYVRADILDRTLTGQCGWRIAGRLQDHTASKLAIGASGAELLGGAGDMLITHGGKVTRVQAALGTAADFTALPQGTEVASPAPREDRKTDPRYIKAPADDRIAYAEQLALQGIRPTGYKLNTTFGKAAKRNHQIAADVRAAFGMG